MSHFNQLTPAEAERLALLAEECAEVIKEVGKILRHGYESKWPKDGPGPTNRENLVTELGHVVAIKGMMIAAGDTTLKAVSQSVNQKLKSVFLYTHHQ